MSLYAEIVAVGGFKPDLIPWLEYPASIYAGTKVGAPMVRTLFGIVEGTFASRRFSELLGIENVWDFNQHKIEPSRIDFQGLETHLKILGGWKEDGYERDLECLKAFSREGFDLYFLPNG